MQRRTGAFNLSTEGGESGRNLGLRVDEHVRNTR
jgi:hypothetical protein